ncbi:MAG: CocE/NonD family hydrolase, partial [Actinobacteria bacterium]|nr:CocE/NonD family hydrolase [Actinomycetota bacterium]
MRRKTSTERVALALVVLLALLVSSQAANAAAPERVSGPEKKCGHPYPCDYTWAGPTGPFEVRPAERVTVTSFDGVKLNGFILRPNVPGDVPVPVILTTTPYIQPGSVPTSFYVGGIPGKEFAEAGYAVAAFSVRGTGDSGGCFGFKSIDEQKDHPVIIDWLAKQPWSNGRVGMQGLSYPGTTPVMAAIQNPPALKTIVIAGTILDEYNFDYTPQGAAHIPA